MKHLALATLAVAGLSACSLPSAIGQDCSPIDITPYAGHVDYNGPSNTWWDTETGRVIGYSPQEDSEILPPGCGS